MTTLETNVFPISDFGGLQATYVVLRAKGVEPEHDEYHENCQRLQKRASRLCAGPAVTLKRQDGAYLAVPAQCMAQLPAGIWLTRAQAKFEKTGEQIDVNFSHPRPEAELIATRFLQSALRETLRESNFLWQPGSGSIFFEKDSRDGTDAIAMHRGFGFYVTRLPDGQFSITVDVHFKFIARRPLRSNLTRQEFASRHKMRTFVYHYGDRWYEVELVNWTGLDVSGYRCGESNGRKSLLAWMHDHCGRPVPANISRLRRDGVVLEYQNDDGETRGVPAELCYRVFESKAEEINRMHRWAAKLPDARRADINEVVVEHLKTIHLGKHVIQISPSAWRAPRERIDVPDLRYGCNKVLSVRGTPGTVGVELSRFGRTRSKMLEDRNAGFFVNDGLYRQYFLMPETVHNSWGPLFFEAFVNSTSSLYPHGNGYAPELVVYDDKEARNYVEHAEAINRAAAGLADGYAVVMLAEPKLKTASREDELAACAGEYLRKHAITPAFVHATSAAQFFYYSSRDRRWVPSAERSRRFNSYLRLAALNKVMLTARKWPFVLKTRLNADLVVGIDLKGNVAGFTAVTADCAKVWSETTETKRKERMSRKKCREMLVKGITKLTAAAAILPRTIVIQRDGRMFESEIDGALDAMAELKDAGAIAADATLTCVEIPKGSIAALRLFDEHADRYGTVVCNPDIGAMCILGPNEGFVCNTGRTFCVPGTVRPLHVRRVWGEVSMKACLEDVFYLACLTWSQPEGCSRYPVTVRLNDRQLIDVATPFDDEDDEAPATTVKSTNHHE